jgi:hypothetical protein
MYFKGASPSIANCIVTGNSASDSGGCLYLQSSLFQPILGPKKWTLYRQSQRFFQHKIAYLILFNS